MILKILGNATMMHMNNICAFHYHCEANEFEISRNFKENPFVDIKHTRAIDGNVLFTISSDNMSAAATFLPPVNGGKALTMQEAMDLVFSPTGIQRSFADEEAFQNAYNQSLEGYIVDGAVVAVGRQPVHGTDALIQIHFEMPSDKPAVQEGGRMYFHKVKKYINVRKDQLLAKIIPAQEGVPGETILGRPIPQVPGKDALLTAGDGVRTSNDGTSLYADHDGYIIYRQNQLSVSNTLEIKGNVDYSTGNIDFTGTVMIKADVLSGFTVKGKDIFIDGICQDALIVAENNIIVKLGIKGGQGENSLSAGGNIEVGYCENAKLSAKGSITIKKYSFNCVLNAGNRIEAGDRTTVTGGTINAFAGGSFYNLGTKANTNLTISLGRKYNMDEKLDRIKEEKKRLMTSIDKIDEALSPLKLEDERIKSNPKVKKLLETKELIAKRIDLFNRRIESVMRESIHPNPLLDVNNEVQAGLTIIFFNTPHSVRQTLKKVQYFFDPMNLVVDYKNL